MPSQSDNQAARHALAKIAEGIAAGEPKQGSVADFLNKVFQQGPNVPQEVQTEFHALFDDLTPDELAKLARMQNTMVKLHGKGYDSLADKFNPTLSKF